VDADTATAQPAAHNVGRGYCRISGNLEPILRSPLPSLFRFSLPPHFPSPSLTLPFPACARSCILFFILQTLPSDQPSRLTRFGLLTSAVAFCCRSYSAPPLAKRSREQLTDFLPFQMVGQQQLQRPPFSVGPSPGMQHNNMLGQFQNNGGINQMTTPQLQAAFQQNRATPAMLASLQPTQARQLELIMAQHQQPHNNPSGLVASRLNQQQSIQQGFPQGMIGGNPNPGQPSQGKFLHYYFRPRLTRILVNPAVQMFNGTSPQDSKRAALQELRDRALHLHTNIKVIEQQQAALSNQRSMMAEGVYLQRMAIAEQDIARKRAILTKWNMMLSANGMPMIGQGG
jgi:hypothetical protein